MTPEAQARNEAILAEVERLGGGSVWEPEVFAVTLMDVAVSDQEALALLGLAGVEQIAINVANISATTLNSIACIAGLNSLVVTGRKIEPPEMSALQSLGPDIEVVEHEA
jgi:hypothetical protein